MYGPGIATTSFVMSLGPSLFADLLKIHSTAVTEMVVFGIFICAISVRFASKNLPTPTRRTQKSPAEVTSAYPPSLPLELALPERVASPARASIGCGPDRG
jgi:hypothetical protein